MSEYFQCVGPNNKDEIVLNGFCKGQVEDNKKKPNSRNVKASLSEETELKGNVSPLQNDTNMTSKNAPTYPEVKNLRFNKSLMNKREDFHLC